MTRTAEQIVQTIRAVRKYYQHVGQHDPDKLIVYLGHGEAREVYRNPPYEARLVEGKLSTLVGYPVVTVAQESYCRIHPAGNEIHPIYTNPRRNNP